jgi:hypothetical protein
VGYFEVAIGPSIKRKSAAWQKCAKIPRYLMMGFAAMARRAGMRGLNEREMGIGKVT